MICLILLSFNLYHLKLDGIIYYEGYIMTLKQYFNQYPHLKALFNATSSAQLKFTIHNKDNHIIAFIIRSDKEWILLYTSGRIERDDMLSVIYDSITKEQLATRKRFYDHSA